MRTVVSNREIAHLWAHQSQPEARSNSMSFDRENFYSYSTTIATITRAANGERVYLVTDGKYSVTTSKHLLYVRRSIPVGAIQFTVPAVRMGSMSSLDDHRYNLSKWIYEVEGTIQDAMNSRQPKRDRLLMEAAYTVKAIRRYCKVFALELPALPEIPGGEKESVERYKAKQERRDEIARQARERREQERRKEYEQSRASWLAGAETWHGLNYFPTMLRVHGERVQTSRGAEFPVEDARKGLQFVRAVMASGHDWDFGTSHLAVQRLGHYHIDKITADGTVHAGCHVVPWASIERIAAQLEA